MSTLNELLQNSATKPAMPVTNPTLKAACENIAKRREENAVKACEGLVEQFTVCLKNSVARLRQTRQEEKAQAKLVKSLDRAIRYFGQTGNPLPVFGTLGQYYKGHEWCSEVGIEVPTQDTWVVPDNYTPENSTTVE